MTKTEFHDLKIGDIVEADNGYIRGVINSTNRYCGETTVTMTILKNFLNSKWEVGTSTYGFNDIFYGSWTILSKSVAIGKIKEDEDSMAYMRKEWKHEQADRRKLGFEVKALKRKLAQATKKDKKLSKKK